MQLKLDPVPPLLANSRQNGCVEDLLYNGSKFQGFIMDEKVERSKPYDMEIIFQHIHWRDYFICGYLNLNTVNMRFSTLTSFFDGEFICEKYPFLTKKWGATEETDREYWGKFRGFENYRSTFNSSEFDYKALAESDYVFMRLKEHCILSDNGIVRDINGGPIPGFYYICLTKSTGILEGCFYRTPWEKYEWFELNHVPPTTEGI
uniref:Glucose-induced degradation protein 4 homolog n=1 Tax=Glossina austeni TaxID=7395 RepID=A0A1A9VAY6_GLOAU